MILYNYIGAKKSSLKTPEFLLRDLCFTLWETLNKHLIQNSAHQIVRGSLWPQAKPFYITLSWHKHLTPHNQTLLVLPESKTNRTSEKEEILYFLCYKFFDLQLCLGIQFTEVKLLKKSINGRSLVLFKFPLFEDAHINRVAILNLRKGETCNRFPFSRNTHSYSWKLVFYICH